MDMGLNVNNGGQQFEIQFPHIDSSTYESPSSYADSGPTRNRRSRLHSNTPYSRNNSNNNRPTTDDTSITWLCTLINNILPSFMSKLLGFSPRRESRRSETTSPRVDRSNEMDIDQRNESLSGIQERLVQSNRIFTEPIQPVNNVNSFPSRSRRRSGTAQNNAIKRKRPEENSVSIEDVEEKLRRKAQIEDQNHKPDLKELYYKNIDPNWYKPFKSNPDNYPKFASSSKVTSDTYGPDPNLNLPKESPPLKKFKPSVTPTPRWFDYYPVRDEDVDRRRTENIVEKRKVEEKTFDKEKALHKSKKGKERADTSSENGKEKPSRTSISPISPLKDQNYFANIRTPVVGKKEINIVTSSKITNGVIENQQRLSSTVVSPSEISNTTENKGKNIATTPETTAQNAKSPSSMESIEYTHEDKSPTPANTTFGNIASEDKEDKEDKVTKNIVNNNFFAKQSQTTTPIVSLVPKPKSDDLADNEKKSVSPSLEPSKDVGAPQETSQITPLPIQQNNINDASVSSLSGTKDQPLLSTLLTSNNDSNISSSFFSNLKNKDQLSVSVTLFSDKNSTGDLKEKKGETKIPDSQSQDNPISDLKEDGLGIATTIPSVFGGSLSTVYNKSSPFASAFASTIASTAASTTASTAASTIASTAASTIASTAASTTVSTAVTTSVPSFSFGTSNFNGFGSSTFSNDGDNNTRKLEKSSKFKSYGPHGARNKRINKRNRGISDMGNEVPNSKNAKTTSNESSTRLQSSFPGEFEFALPPKDSSLAPPLFSSGSENTTQSTFNFNFGRTQTPSTSAPVFGTSVASNSSLFGTNSISTATSNMAFGFGANTTASASTGFTFGGGGGNGNNFFGATQISAAISGPTNGLGTQLNIQTAPNFNNPTMQNGQQNNSFHSNITQQNQQIFGSALDSTKTMTNSFLQQNQSQGTPLSFNFGNSNGQGFNHNTSLIPNQNQGFGSVNPSQINFFGGPEQGGQQGNRQMVNGRRIKIPRSRRQV